jgi:hypothetical protein
MLHLLAIPAATAAEPHVKVRGHRRRKSGRKEERRNLSASSSAVVDGVEDVEKAAVDDKEHAAVDKAEAEEGALGELLSLAVGAAPKGGRTLRAGSYLGTSPAPDSNKRDRGTVHSSGGLGKKARK